MNQRIKQFFFPQMTRNYVRRIILFALAVYLFFKFVCLPFRVQGQSMEPTYADGGFNFCFKLRYVLNEPKEGMWW